MVILVACGTGKNTIDSRDLPEAERVDTLARYVTLKSSAAEAAYRLFDVNMSGRGVPGASSADYKIYLKVAPADVGDWTRGREGWITSFPVSRDWTAEIMDQAGQNRLAALDFVVYREEKPGYTYTMWVNGERGVILIRYIVR